MGNITKQKVVNNFVEFWNDTRYVRGKPPANRKLKRYLKAKTGSNIWQMISVSPTDVQFLAHYTDTPIEARRRWLDDTLYTLMVALYNPLLRLVYSTIWHMSEGISSTEIKEWLEQSVGRELSDVMFKEMPKQLGTDGMIKFGMDILGLFPGSIAGANTRLKRILERRSMKQGEYKSEYEQDLSVALWECSEGAHLDEFTKMLSKESGCHEEVTNLRRIFKEKDSHAIRGIVLRIIQKTIEDLPDIKEQLQEQRRAYVRGKEIEREEERLQKANATNDTLFKKRDPPNLEADPDLLEPPSPADLLGNIGISRDNTSETEWQDFMMLSQEILDGELEVGSKTGLSISATFGKDAARLRKTISRYRERQLHR